MKLPPETMEKRMKEKCYLASGRKRFIDYQRARPQLRELAKLLVDWQRAEWARQGRKAA